LAASARTETNLRVKAELLKLSANYQRLSEQASANCLTEVVHEPPFR